MVNALIVGDKKFASSLLPVVKGGGLDAVHCLNIKEASNIQRREKVDCAFIQERYEDGLGEDLMTELKKNASGTAVVVTLLRRDADQALRWMELGAYECLSEPINADDARIVIRGVVKTLSGAVIRRSPLKEKLAAVQMFSFKTLAVVLGIVCIGLLAVWGGMRFKNRSPSAARTESKELPLSFRLPYPNPTGLTWDGKDLWISDWSTQTIYKHKIDSSLTLDKFFPMSDIPSVSLTWGDNALWTVGQDSNIRKHLLDGRLTVALVIRVADIAPSALAWDGKALWSCDSQARKIYRHIMDDNLTVSATYDFPGKNPVGMVWVGKDLWVADEGTGTLYRLKLENEVFTLAENVRPGVHLPGTNRLSGLTTDGKNLWTISEGNGLIFRHSFTTLRGG